MMVKADATGTAKSVDKYFKEKNSRSMRKKREDRQIR